MEGMQASCSMSSDLGSADASRGAPPSSPLMPSSPPSHARSPRIGSYNGSSIGNDKRSRRLSRDSRPSLASSTISITNAPAPPLGQPDDKLPKRTIMHGQLDSPALDQASRSPRMPHSPLIARQLSPAGSSTSLRSLAGSSTTAPRTPQRRATHDTSSASSMDALRVQLPVYASHEQNEQRLAMSAAEGLGRCRSHRESRTMGNDAIVEINDQQQQQQRQQLRNGGKPASPASSSWSHRARRWSNSLPRGRQSAAFAYRLAEGASPYLRAGLEELRSIFDVDSDPVPSSPFEEDGSGDEEQSFRRASSGTWARRGPLRRESSGSSSAIVCIDDEAEALPEASPPLTNGPLTVSPLSVSPTSSTPPAEGGEGLSKRSSSGERARDDSHGSVATGVNREKDPGHAGTKASQYKHTYSSSIASTGDPRATAHRSSTKARGVIAWSLVAIVIGMTCLCAWGYATQSDIFSATLIGFFLAQPGFALIALVALLTRKRALMDLSSRAMRAHVLAQGVIVVLAYLDLSASSIYAAGNDVTYRSHGAPSKQRFRMLPSMEMRFGPLNTPFEAGWLATATRGGDNNVLASTTSSSASSAASIAHAAAMARLAAAASDDSLHAHDTHVGDWRSRLTHLVVFLVQGAAPLVMILVGQYIVGQRLAGLARNGSLSRQSSLRGAGGNVGPSSSGHTDDKKSALQEPSGSLASRRASRQPSRQHTQYLAPPSPVIDNSSRSRHRQHPRAERKRPSTTDGSSLSHHFVVPNAPLPNRTDTLPKVVASLVSEGSSSQHVTQLGTSRHRAHRSSSQPLGMLAPAPANAATDVSGPVSPAAIV